MKVLQVFLSITWAQIREVRFRKAPSWTHQLVCAFNGLNILTMNGLNSDLHNGSLYELVLWASGSEGAFKLLFSDEHSVLST